MPRLFLTTKPCHFDKHTSAESLREFSENRARATRTATPDRLSRWAWLHLHYANEGGASAREELTSGPVLSRRERNKHGDGAERTRVSPNFHRCPLELCQRTHGDAEARLRQSDPGHAARAQRQGVRYDRGRHHPGNGGEQRPAQVLRATPAPGRSVPHQVHGWWQRCAERHLRGFYQRLEHQQSHEREQQGDVGSGERVRKAAA